MEKKIYETVKLILEKYIGCNNIGDEDVLIDGLNISSRQFISFILELQAEFGFDIEEEQGIFENMHSISSIVDYLKTCK